MGNGVFQDILFNAGIHPKRKISKLSDFEKGELFESIKTTLKSMADKGGRDKKKTFMEILEYIKFFFPGKPIKNPILTVECL